ncbi:MAG: DUF4384 domain-containing protein [Blastocatellia bacterium]|nr:DUF4384 domain-containing protein [Blastocatellia bacterium]
MKNLFPLLFTLCLLAGSALSQASPSADITIVALRPGAGGALEPVPAGHEFRAGDRLRLQITSRIGGHLYLVYQAASGKVSLLLPAAGESRPIKPGEKALFPRNSDLVFDEKAGVDALHAFVVPAPLPQLAAVRRRPGGELSLDEKAFLANYLGVSFDDTQTKTPSRDLEFDKPAKTDGEKRPRSPRAPASASVRITNKGRN